MDRVFSRLPRRGYVLQPRVAALGYPGLEGDLCFNRKAVAPLCGILLRVLRNRVAVENPLLLLPRVVEATTPGLEDIAPSGINKKTRIETELPY